MGSGNSLLFQNLENQCLMALMQAARDMGIAKSDAVLMFDGIMILREDVHAFYAQQNAPMPSLPMTNTASGRQVMRWYHLSELAGTGRRQMTTACCLTGCVPVIAHAIQTYKVCISEAIHVESLKKVQPEIP